MIVNPAGLAEKFRAEIKESIIENNLKIELVGLLASLDEASSTYSQYMKVGCEKVGVTYHEIVLDKEKIGNGIQELNSNPAVTGVIVYYPIYGGEKDKELRGTLSPLKDVEGLHSFWLTKLYSNERTFVNNGLSVKALLPCTPLAVLKLFDSVAIGTGVERPFSGKTITIFNRSEVVGRPLAYMLANDGARVFSFDINDVLEFSLKGGEVKSHISRQEALALSDIVITGVPNSSFDKIKIEELKAGVCCLNFSSFENFEADVKEAVDIFIPRVGPVTVSMCLRNLVRMAQSFRI